MDIIAEAEELLATQVDHQLDRREKEDLRVKQTRASARTGSGSEPQVGQGRASSEVQVQTRFRTCASPR